MAVNDSGDALGLKHSLSDERSLGRWRSVMTRFQVFGYLAGRVLCIRKHRLAGRAM